MKTCPCCGASVPDGVNECPQCGGAWLADGSFDQNACFAGIGADIKPLVACEPVPYDAPAAVAMAKKRGHAGVVYGVLGLVTGILLWLLVSFGSLDITLAVPALALIGIVLSEAGRRRAERGRSAESLATAGLLCSGAALCAVVIIALVVIVSALVISLG